MQNVLSSGIRELGLLKKSKRPNLINNVFSNYSMAFFKSIKKIVKNYKKDLTSRRDFVGYDD